MVKQLKIIVQDASNLGSGFITANFQQPIIIKAGSKVCLDKFYADTIGIFDNFLLPEQNFSVVTNIGDDYTKTDITLPQLRYTDITHFLEVFNNAINDGISAYYASAAATPTKANEDLGYSLALSLDKDKRAEFTWNIVKESTITKAQTNMDISALGGYVPPSGGLTFRVQTFDETIQENAVSENYDSKTFLIQGGGLSVKSSIILADNITTEYDFQWGITDAINTTTGLYGNRVSMRCRSSADVNSLSVVGMDAAGTELATHTLSTTSLYDAYALLPNTKSSYFQWFNSGGYWKLRYKLAPTGDELNGISAGETLVIGRLYQIKKSGTTNYLGVGAASNAVGTQFEATSKGLALTGNGALIVPSVDVILFDGSAHKTESIWKTSTYSKRWYAVGTTNTDGGENLRLPQISTKNSFWGTFNGATLTSSKASRLTNIDFTDSPILANNLGVTTNMIIPPLVNTNGFKQDGIYTGIKDVNFSNLKFDEEVALELIDFPLDSYSANGGKYVASNGQNWGARNNVLSYFTPVSNDITQNHFSFQSPVYQWLKIKNTTEMNIASLSFRVFNVYTPTTPVELKSVSFNILIDETGLSL